MIYIHDQAHEYIKRKGGSITLDLELEPAGGG